METYHSRSVKKTRGPTHLSYGSCKLTKLLRTICAILVEGIMGCHLKVFLAYNFDIFFTA